MKKWERIIFIEESTKRAWIKVSLQREAIIKVNRTEFVTSYQDGIEYVQQFDWGRIIGWKDQVWPKLKL